MNELKSAINAGIKASKEERAEGAEFGLRVSLAFIQEFEERINKHIDYCFKIARDQVRSDEDWGGFIEADIVIDEILESTKERIKGKYNGR